MCDNYYDWFLTDRFGKLYNFDKSKIILGRKDCDIHLKSNSVDYKHCILSINDRDRSLKIKDLETANGTFINETQITPNHFKLLNVGDKIRLAYDQITFTVQKKPGINFNNSPSRGTELPSLVTDPERFMSPAVCELTDSIIESNSPIEAISSISHGKVDDNCNSKKKLETKIENSEDEGPAIVTPKNVAHLNENFSQPKEISNNNVSVLNVQSRPAESFTIDFTSNDGSEGVPIVGLSKFVPSKLRMSFEGRVQTRAKLQSSNSFNKPDTIRKSNESLRLNKVESKNSSIKPPKATSVTKNKVTPKTDDVSVKSKVFSFTKKVPDKSAKSKTESNTKIFTKQFSREKKPPKDNREKKNLDNLDKSSANGNEEIKLENNNRDTKQSKNTIIHNSNITPTLNVKNTKSYLLEKMLMGNDSKVDFINYDDRNQTEIELIPEKELQIEKNYSVPVIDDICEKLKINHDCNDAASEAGTYVIENDINEKTIDTEDTLEKDDTSTISSTHFYTKELESKSSTKWLSEFPTDDSLIDIDGKSKRNTNAKFTGCSMPHIPSNIPVESERNKNFRDDTDSKSNTHCVVNDMRNRNSRAPSYNAGDPNNNLNSDDQKNWNACDLEMDKKVENSSKINFQSHQQMPTSPYSMGNQSLLVAEDVYVSDVVTNSTVPTNSYTRILPHKSKELDLFTTLSFSSAPPNPNYHPRPTYSVASLDTALLLQDTEALLNDMEKRVYSRREIKTTEEFSRLQSFPTSFPQSEKIPYVDDGEEKEEDTSLFNYSTEVEEGVRLAAMKQQTSLASHSDSVNLEDKNRSYTVRSPITSGIIRRNNSCKVGVSESLVPPPNIAGRKLNSTIRNQRSCSLIEERKSNHNNNNVESFTDYRNKPKPSLLAMNPGTFVNRRGSGGYSSALNSPITKFEPISVFNSSFSNQKMKDPIPYLSNMLSVHRQKFNRYEYGQHSLKYNSNSTTMLYNKYNNTSPPWNGEDTNILNHNSVYPNYDADYYSYSTMPEPFEASMLFLKHEPSIIENMQHHQLNIDSSTDPEFQRREDIIEYTQHGNISGRSSAFSPVNSLHQSNESVNTFQITNKSRSSIGLNEQRLYNYDFLLVSSIHLYSARLCRYTEEIVHRLRREDTEYKGSSPIDPNAEQSDTFGQLKSANRELQETLNNMRSLEKQLQKIEKAVFPPEKSGRNSTLGSCTEDSYLNQLERINKELEDFVPIDDEKATANKNQTATKTLTRPEYSYLTTGDSKPPCQITISKSQHSMDKGKSKTRSDIKLDQTKNSFSTSEICSPTKSKYSSLSKRFQHRKD